MRLGLPIIVLFIAATIPVAAVADGKLEKEFQALQLEFHVDGKPYVWRWIPPDHE